MGKKARLLIGILAGIVFLFSLVSLLRKQINYKEGDAIYNEAEKMSGLPQLPTIAATPLPQSGPIGEIIKPAEGSNEEEPVKILPSLEGDVWAEYLAELDLNALKDENSDVFGWILIPDTVINYPLVHGADNAYYLKHTWNLEENIVGSVFLDSSLSSDLNENFNSILYGHRMNNGSMFGKLYSYNSAKYLKSHPSIYVRTENEIKKYDIYATYEARLREYTYIVEYPNDELKQEMIDFSREKSVVKTDIVPDCLDHLLTLSTCTTWNRNSRWVVVGVLTAQTNLDESVSSSIEESIK